MNCIVPGFTPNERMPELPASHNEAYDKATLLRARRGEPWETAGLSVFFASKLSSYVTGQAVASDGGITVASASPDPPTRQ